MGQEGLPQNPVPRPIADPETALNKYLEERDDLQVGRTLRTRREGLTVRGLVTRFLTTEKSLMDSGKLALRTWCHYYLTFERLVDFFYKDRRR